MAETAVVTGGNRGLGREVCRQLAEQGLHVVLTARDAKAARVAAEDLGAENLGVGAHPLDVTDLGSIKRLAKSLRETGTCVDVLVNNAGVMFRGFDADVVRKTLAVNVFGVVSTTDQLLPLLSRTGCITMVSSGMGELSTVSSALRERFENPLLSRDALDELMHEFLRDVESGRHRERGWPSSAYRVSKLGLNAFTRILARELEETGIRVNAVCPGWVRTDMGGRAAPRSAEEGARSIVATAMLPPGGPSGFCFRDGDVIPW